MSVVEEIGENLYELHEEVEVEEANYSFDLEGLLEAIETMGSQKPVAAQIVSAVSSEDTSARELAALVGADVALTGRIMKLANSAFYGMRGRVTSLQFAITAVGFTTVRAMASVALTQTNTTELPASFWLDSTHTALAASEVAQRFGVRRQDALCVGLLAQLGAALLHHHDPEGYAAVSLLPPVEREATEMERYGISSIRLTAIALREWHFPEEMVTFFDAMEDPANGRGAVLRVAIEVSARLSSVGRSQSMESLSVERISELDAAALLTRVRTEAAELRTALGV